VVRVSPLWVSLVESILRGIPARMHYLSQGHGGIIISDFFYNSIKLYILKKLKFKRKLDVIVTFAESL
jgi:hypothetical protein